MLSTLWMDSVRSRRKPRRAAGLPRRSLADRATVRPTVSSERERARYDQRVARSTFSDLDCSIARTLEIVGSRWTLLVLRDLFAGITRFDAIQADLGISRKVLAERLASLEDDGVVERRAYQDNPPRYDYVLTQKGSELGSLLLAMIAWGDRWEAGADGPPLLVRHERCGKVTHAVAACSECGAPLDRGNVTPVTPPGSRSAPAAA